MKKAEYAGNGGFLQRDSVEHEEYAEAHSGERMETEEQDNAEDLMERILDRDSEQGVPESQVEQGSARGSTE